MDWFRVEFRPRVVIDPDYWVPWRVGPGTDTLRNRPDVTFLTRKEANEAIQEIKDSEEDLVYRVFKIELTQIEEGSSEGS